MSGAKKPVNLNNSNNPAAAVKVRQNAQAASAVVDDSPSMKKSQKLHRCKKNQPITITTKTRIHVYHDVKEPTRTKPTEAR